jgi:hypothetical protein
VATVSDEEVEHSHGEDCVDGVASGRQGVGHCASQFCRNATSFVLSWLKRMLRQRQEKQ